MKKIALVTGGNRGIGKAICEGLAKEDTKVLLGTRHLQNGVEALASIPPEISNNIEIVELDLSSRDKRSKQIHEIYDKYGDIDILINYAGVLYEGNIVEAELDELYTTMEVNFFAPYELIKFYLPKMITKGDRRIVNISSGWGSFASELSGPVTYSISKAALNAITKTTSHSSSMVKINSMCPGWVSTRMGGVNATRSTEEGAKTAIWLAKLDENGPNGKFFRDKREIDW